LVDNARKALTMCTAQPRRRGLAPVGVVLATVLATLLAGCSGGSTSGGAAASAGGPAAAKVSTLRLGFFPNLTHAPALVGLQEGLFTKALKPLGVTVTPTAFNAGPDAVTALFSGSLDIAFVGPNPTINAYVASHGEAVRVISGAASGGAALVVRSGIAAVGDLRGRTLATPQLGNTQDVALRSWLKGQGLATDSDGGGDVSIRPQPNAEGLTAFRSGSIDGAWVPQPWVAEYVAAGAHVLVDEATLWPGGRFVTTNVVARTDFLVAHADVVRAFLAGHLAALDLIATQPALAKSDVNASLQALTGGSLTPGVLAAAWPAIQFTADPLASTLLESAKHAVDVGQLEQSAVDGAGGLPGTLYDLAPLDALLAAAGRPTLAP
jgi:NitT/TauT family transport system substrate-binding protein